MPYPVIEFSNITDWYNYTNTEWVTNGAGDITGVIGNNVVNGAIKFVKQSPLNWAKMAVYNTAGDVSLSNNFLGTVLFTGLTPNSLTWGDNFYNQYVFVNMTADPIPLAGLLVYYDLTGTPQSAIPANTALNIFKATNDLWVQGNTIGGTGSTQKQPKTYVVGTTVGAPTAGTLTWQNTAFANSYVVLFINYSKANQSDAGNGSPYITKASLASDTITVGNYGAGWVAGDILDYILITP